MKDEHTFLFTRSQNRIAQSPLQVICFIFIILSDFLYELFPSGAGDFLHSIIKVSLHCQKVFPVMLPESHSLKVISAILTVNQIRVSIKLSGGNRHAVSGVLHHTVTKPPVTHLRHKAHILLALFFVRDFSAVQCHKPHKLFNL